MEQNYENKGHPNHTIFVHVNHSSSNTGGFRAVLVHPNAFLLAATYGIEDENPSKEVVAYLETTLPFVVFGLEPSRPGHHLKLTLEEYLLFLDFLVKLWPSARDLILAQKDTSNERNEFHLIGNLWGYGTGEMTYNCHISREVLFQAWNSVVIDKTSQSMEMKFNARLKKGLDILWIDFQSLSNIVKDDSEEQYLRKVFKAMDPKRKASFQQ